MFIVSEGTMLTFLSIVFTGSAFIALLGAVAAAFGE